MSDDTASKDTVGDATGSNAASAVRPFADLIHIEVNSRWCLRVNIARWWLRRMINDATLQGYPEMVVHVAHPYAALLNLLAQHGFQELNYRGYSLELSLTD